MDNDYPKMVYQYPGSMPLQDGLYDYIIVFNKAEEKQAIKDGWFLTFGDARADFEKPAKPINPMLIPNKE